jgi:hypothetical protein
MIENQRTIHCLEQVQQELLDTVYWCLFRWCKMSGSAVAGLLFGFASTSTMHLQIIQTILKIIFL